MKLTAPLLALAALLAGSTATPTSTLERRAAPQGVDISHYQGTVNFNTLVANGLSFVYIKATEAPVRRSAFIFSAGLGGTDHYPDFGSTQRTRTRTSQATTPARPPRGSSAAGTTSRTPTSRPARRRPSSSSRTAVRPPFLFSPSPTRTKIASLLMRHHLQADGRATA